MSKPSLPPRLPRFPHHLRLRIPEPFWTSFRKSFRTTTGTALRTARRITPRLPILTTGERAAVLVLTALLATGAILHAWERSGATFGPVEDLDTLRAWVLQARETQGNPEYPCDAADRARSGPRERTEPPAEKTVAAIDLNTADEALLVTLPGVGPATARAILAHRAAHGPFRSVDDVIAVRGIGPRKLEDLRPYVHVTPPP